MSKLQINATEVVQPEVGFMALVKRGANRIPFRVVKEDTNDMIDLSQVTRAVFAKAAFSPLVIGVALAKGADDAMLTAALTASGISLDGFVKADLDGAITLTKTDAKAAADEILVVKFDDSSALMIMAPSEFVKSMTTYDWESTSFKEVMTKGTFTPSVVMAQDMLQRTYFNIMEKAENPKDLARMLKAATGEFEEYIVSLAKGLPDAVFKADVEFSKLSKAAKAKAKDCKTEPDADEAMKKAAEVISSAPQNGNETAAGTITTGDGNIDGKPVVGNATPTNSTDKPKTGAPAGTKDVEGTSITKDEDPVATAMAAFTKQLGEAMTTMNTNFTTMTKAVKDDITKVSERVEAVAAQVKKTDDALAGVVLGDPKGESSTVRKSERETDSAPPLLDTAFNAA